MKMEQSVWSQSQIENKKMFEISTRWAKLKSQRRNPHFNQVTEASGCLITEAYNQKTFLTSRVSYSSSSELRIKAALCHFTFFTKANINAVDKWKDCKYHILEKTKSEVKAIRVNGLPNILTF